MNDYEKALFNLYWLRPENAVLTSVQMKLLKKENLAPKGKSLDVSCGDGLFSLMLCEGALSEEFDIYRTVADVTKLDGNKDMYNTFDDRYQPLITKKPSIHFDYGFDINPRMLARAERINLYKQLSQLDTTIDKFPIENESLDYISCFLSVNHFPTIDNFFLESYRSLKKGGKLVLTLYLPVFVEAYSQWEKSYGKDWNDIVERGMRDLWPVLKYVEEWKIYGKQKGFSSIEAIPMLQKDFVQFWNIGFRPLAPQLVKLVNGVNDVGTLNEVRHEWTQTLRKLLSPFTEQAKTIEGSGTVCLILEK